MTTIDYGLSSISCEDINKLATLSSKEDICKNKKYILQVADDPKILQFILEKIADIDQYGLTHKSLIKNSNISIGIIHKITKRCLYLIEQSEKNINNISRRIHEILLNPITPSEIIEKLATWMSSQIRAIVANTSEMPTYLVKKILLDFDNNGDGDDLARHYRFLNNMLISTELIDKSVLKLQEYLTSNPDDTGWRIKSKLKNLCNFARHPNININTLRNLLESKNDKIIKGALLNPKISQYILEEWGVSLLGDIHINNLHILANNTFISDSL